MNRILIPVIAVFIVAAMYIMSTAQRPAIAYLGYADAIGSDDDEQARENYETKMLLDPTGKIPENIRARELAFAATLPTDKYLAAGRSTAALSWQSRGPWNVGGRTRALAIDVTNENNIIAGSASGSIWRSTDGGATWTACTPPNQYKGATCLAQDTRPGHTSVWYYGTGEEVGASASVAGADYLGNGIYKSTDGGITWDTLHTTTLPLHSATLDVWADIVWNIVTDPTRMDSDVVYAAVKGAIYRSADGGASWSGVLGTFNSSEFVYNYSDIAISKTGVLYATLDKGSAVGGIFRSTDGINWTNITPAGFATNYNRIKIGISPSDERQVYFLGNTPGSGMLYTNYVGQQEWNSLWRYIYLSGDGSGSGGHWQDRSLNLPSNGTIFDKFTCQGSYDLVVKVKPDDTNVVFIGGTNLYRSTTGFADTSHTTFIGGYKHGATLPVVLLYQNHHPDQHELVFYPSNPNKMISGNDGGIFVTNDNTVPTVLWTSLNRGYLTTMFYTCATDHTSTNDIIIGGAQDNGSWFTNSSDPAQPWATPNGGDGSFCAIGDSGSTYYFSTQLGRTIKAQVSNLGHVNHFARIDPRGGRGYQFVNPFALDPNNNHIMYMAGGKVLWRNNDLSGIPFAGNFDSISTNWFMFPDSNLVPGTPYAISALAASAKPANRVYIGTTDRKLYRLDSANTATHIYHDITYNLFPTFGSTYYGYIISIAVDPNNGDNVMVAFANYGVYSLFYSSNGGATWQKVAGNLEQNKVSGAGDGPSFRWASIIPTSNGNVYMVGTSTGLYATTKLSDTSTVWVQQGANTIGNSVVDMIDYRATDGLVVVATHSSGMYSAHITSTGDITGVPDVAANTEAFDFTNFPNPFSNQTSIRFDLKHACHVTVQVYDQSGRLVTTIANGGMDAGIKTYIFDAANLPAGMYYCTLRAGASSGTRKLLLLK